MTPAVALDDAGEGVGHGGQAPHVEIVWFDDAGHMIPFESPDAFQSEVLERVLPVVRAGEPGPS